MFAYFSFIFHQYSDEIIVDKRTRPEDIIQSI